MGSSLIFEEKYVLTQNRNLFDYKVKSNLLSFEIPEISSGDLAEIITSFNYSKNQNMLITIFPVNNANYIVKAIFQNLGPKALERISEKIS